MKGQKRSYRRRSVLAAVGTALVGGASGCLRLTDAESGAGGQQTETGRAPEQGTQNANRTPPPEFYATRSEAISYVGSFARGEPGGYGTYEGDGPKKIAFSTSSGGSSGTTGPNESLIRSRDIDIESYAPGGFRFGGDTGRALRVRNLASGTTLTFEPEPGTTEYDISGVKIDTRGEGELRDQTPGFDVVSSDEATISGTWSGDRQLFMHQPFARYVVELLEDGTVIGETGGRIYGKAYQYGVDQTRETLFLTRQGSVREDWQAVFYLGRGRSVPSVEAAHRPDDGVFEIDLTALDADAGEYGGWSLRLSPPNADNRYNQYISLSSLFGTEIYLP